MTEEEGKKLTKLIKGSSMVLYVKQSEKWNNDKLKHKHNKKNSKVKELELENN